MKIPRIIELIDNNAIVLQQTLLAVRPNEGCALLIGKSKKSNHSRENECWQIHLIWPCSNVWLANRKIMNDIEESNINDPSTSIPSKRNRFRIDPKEQISAQKWARTKQWKVLGSAHSHPSSNAIPSQVDLSYSFYSRLMVIIDQFGKIKAWWLTENQKYEEIEVACGIYTKTINK